MEREPEKQEEKITQRSQRTQSSQRKRRGTEEFDH